jgi:hypothetical protein
MKLPVRLTSIVKNRLLLISLITTWIHCHGYNSATYWHPPLKVSRKCPLHKGTWSVTIFGMEAVIFNVG